MFEHGLVFQIIPGRGQAHPPGCAFVFSIRCLLARRNAERFAGSATPAAAVSPCRYSCVTRITVRSGCRVSKPWLPSPGCWPGGGARGARRMQEGPRLAASDCHSELCSTSTSAVRNGAYGWDRRHAGSAGMPARGGSRVPHAPVQDRLAEFYTETNRHLVRRCPVAARLAAGPLDVESCEPTTTMEWPMLKRLLPRSVLESVRSAVGVTSRPNRSFEQELPWRFILPWFHQPQHPPSMG